MFETSKLAKCDVQNLNTKVWCSKPQYQSVMLEIWNIKTRKQFSQNLKPQNQSVMLKLTRLQCDVQKLKTKVWCSKQEH
jgi:hypothetical protein